ncbi:DUF2931 family protein [uncultured Capnocytophaga sp.]|uniref:DUF2931 family protein n=1 Tax=uncultured Capnocytophaga sp. TaxID=159273 RepID=UPI002612407E|nr:DUF2931 family protein [uncultured Capnocytophaga sp.]
MAQTFVRKIWLFLFLPLQLASCQNHNSNNKDMNEPEYEWGISVNAPIGYPIHVYAGRVGPQYITSDLWCSTEEPDWGSAYVNEGNDPKELPKDIDIVWFSFIENCFYNLQASLDYEKIEKLFKEGFEQRIRYGELRHTTYDGLVVGLAPGGTVVVWVGKGYSPITEVGRFQASQIYLTETSDMDSHELLIFDKEYRKSLATAPNIVPLEVQKANEGKPIPYNLWDRYAETQYRWYPTFEIPDGKMGDVFFQYWNGEANTIFYTDLEPTTERETILKPKVCQEPIGKLPLYKEISINYKAFDGIKYAATITFDWEQSGETYKKVFGEHPEEVTAQLYFRLNRNNTHVTTRLIGSNGKDLIIEPKNISIAEINQNRAPFD